MTQVLLLTQPGINCFGISVKGLLSKFTLAQLDARVINSVCLLQAHSPSWDTGLISVDLPVTCLTDEKQVSLCLHMTDTQLYPVSNLENEAAGEKYCSYWNGGGEEISGNLPSLPLPPQTGETFLKKKKNPTNYVVLLLVWTGQWLVKIYGFISTRYELAF